MPLNPGGNLVGTYPKPSIIQKKLKCQFRWRNNEGHWTAWLEVFAIPSVTAFFASQTETPVLAVKGHDGNVRQWRRLPE